MTIEELLGQIPPTLEYSFTLQRIGYRYYCYLKITNGAKKQNLNGSSNELGVALQLLSDDIRNLVAND